MQIKQKLCFWIPFMENKQKKILLSLVTSALTWLNELWVQAATLQR